MQCVLRCQDRVMLMADASGQRHVLPGGRVEAGESYLAALAREIREETGYAVATAELLGACIFTHKTPRPEAYGYPYPTFIHPVYRSEAGRHDRAARENEGYEVPSEFVTRRDLGAIPLTGGERALVDATHGCTTNLST